MIVLSGGHSEVPRTVDKYRQGTACNATLRTACGTTIRAHRIVLAGKSEYFEALFGAASDVYTEADGIVELGQISAAELERCVEWMYVGKVVVASDTALRNSLIDRHVLAD